MFIFASKKNKPLKLSTSFRPGKNNARKTFMNSGSKPSLKLCPKKYIPQNELDRPSKKWCFGKIQKKTLSFGKILSLFSNKKTQKTPKTSGKIEVLGMFNGWVPSGKLA